MVVIAAAAIPTAEAVMLGDEVTYYFTVYDENDLILYTTDPTIAASELDAGNLYVEPNLTASAYEPRHGIVSASPLDAPDANYTGISPSRYILGYREGDIVETPLIVAALGKA